MAVFALALPEGSFDLELRASIAIAIWWVVLVGLFVRAWPGSRPPTAALVAGGCLAGITALSALSLLWAEDAGRAFGDLLTPVVYLGLFALVVLASRRASARTWLVGIGAGLVAICLLALLSKVEPGLLGYADRELAEDLPLAADRLSYPIGYWNGLAGCAAIAVVLLGWLGASARTREWRAIATGLVPAVILVIFLTQSRGGAVAALAGLAILAVLAGTRVALAGTLALGAAGGLVLSLLAESRDAFQNVAPDPAAETQGLEMGLAVVLIAIAVAALRYALDARAVRLEDRLPRVPRRVAIGVGAAAIAIVVAVGIATDLPDQFTDTGAYSGTDERLSLQGSGRTQFWSAALDAYAENPIGGIGAGNFELYWNSNASLQLVIQHAHSLPLEMLAELGPLGLALVVAFFGTAVISGVTRIRRNGADVVAAALAVLVAGVATATIEWTWDIPGVFAPVIMAAALLTGPATLRPAFPRALDEPEPAGWRNRLALGTPRERFGIGVATMLAGFAAIWIAGVALLTELQLSESRDATDRGDLEAAEDAARDAETVQPWSVEPPLQLAQVEELRGRLDEARNAAAAARQESPDDWRTWFVTARIEAEAGRKAESDAALERAAALSPTPLPSLEEG